MLPSIWRQPASGDSSALEALRSQSNQFLRHRQTLHVHYLSLDSADYFCRTIFPIVYPEYVTTSWILASLRVFPGLVVIVTTFRGRSTLTVATSGCFRNVFSIP